MSRKNKNKNNTRDINSPLGAEANWPTPDQLEARGDNKCIHFLTQNGFADLLDYEDWYDQMYPELVGKEDDMKSWFGDSNDTPTSLSKFKNNSTTYKAPSTGKQGALYGGTSYVHKKSCPTHDGTKVVFRRGNDKFMKEVAGAQGSQILVEPEVKLVVDLAGMFSPPKPDTIKFTSGTLSMSKQDCSWTDKMEDLSSHIYQPPVLDIKWEDMGVPPLDFFFWKDLWSILPNGRTVVCCFGGHGRTGTGLACLLMAADKSINAEKATSVVHAKHCDNAIESSSQEKYLEKIQRQRDHSLSA